MGKNKKSTEFLLGDCNIRGLSAPIQRFSSPEHKNKIKFFYSSPEPAIIPKWKTFII